MFTVLMFFHVIVCFALIAVVLMQSSKGEGLAGSSFSGGVSGAVFGGRGVATILSRATTYLAVIFFLSCATLAYMSAGRSGVARTASGTNAESVVTKQAQDQMQRQAQQQQNAQNALPVVDSTNGGQTPVQVTPGSAQPATGDKK